jgi:hypothetical protein
VRVSIPAHLRQGLYKGDAWPSLARRTLHLQAHVMCAREFAMKPLWAQTLAWIAAVAAAVLLALANPDGLGFNFDQEVLRPQGAGVPR